MSDLRKPRLRAQRFSSASRVQDRRDLWASPTKVQQTLNSSKIVQKKTKTKESWESFDYDPSRLYKLVEEHGRKPKLLIDKSRTKNVTARKRALLGGPSDWIGANYTPSAKHLLLR